MARFNRNASALLPSTQCLFNNRAIMIPRVGEYWDEVAVYVAKNVRTEKVVFFSSCGRFGGDKWNVGTIHEIMHDQTHADLGNFQIINIIEVNNGVITKAENDQYVDKKAPLWVFK